MAKINDIEIFVIEEKPTFPNYSTDQPIEDDQEVTDHVKKETDKFQIKGQATGEDAGNKFNQLKKLRNKGEPVLYVGRNYFSRVVVESFGTEHDKNIANGFRFTMRLKQIKISRPSPVEQLPTEQKTQAKQPSNKGRQQDQEESEPVYERLPEPLTGPGSSANMIKNLVDTQKEYNVGTPRFEHELEKAEEEDESPLSKSNFRAF